MSEISIYDENGMAFNWNVIGIAIQLNCFVPVWGIIKGRDHAIYEFQMFSTEFQWLCEFSWI